MSDFSLIANSGIQFHSVKINLGMKSAAMKVNADFYEKIEEDIEGNKEIQFVFPYYHEKLQKYIELTDEIQKVAVDPQTGEIEESRIPQSLIRTIPEHKIITVRAREAVESYEGVWIPIPYLRKSYDGTKFQQGPETWAMMWISRISGTDDESEYTHNVVLAFDTRCADNNEAYLTPTVKDAQNSVFECAVKPANNFFFCARSWVQEWLRNEFEKKRSALGKNDDEYNFLHTSFYLTLLKVLGKADTFPKLTLYTHNVSIDVDLILDVGNSRTTGILVESVKTGQPFEFTDAVPLEIRDMTYPDRIYSEPFDMRVAFVKTSLGDESQFILSGNPKAFAWPSLVRIGREAQRLTVLNTADNSNSVMSSPKRYLWDLEKRTFPWTYISKAEETFQKPALYGIAELFTEDGKLLEYERQKAEQDPELKKPYPAMNPYFSRSSLMTFALAEIFMQAVTYVNSYSFRKRQGQENLPRKLKRIVLTCPTAMLQTEQVILREHAKEALESLKAYFGHGFIDENLTIIPEADDIRKDADKRDDWNYDEATCNQLTFVYGEIKDRFMNNAKLYINTVGKLRQDTLYPSLPAVTIASVDIGGGTTDLMIASYQANPDANISVLTPAPMFWEGFNLAGDDILKRVIERIVLPTIKIYAEKCGTRNSVNVMNFLFGPYLGRTTAKDKLMKKQFAMQIAIPIATDILQHASEERPPERRSFESFFVNYPHPNAQLVEYINQEFRNDGAESFDLEKITWELDNEGTNKVVKDVVEKMIGDLCGIVAQYECDYVLLSGRPSLLPVVRDLFLKYLPVTPDKVVQLGHYRIGTWYPFAEGTGVIKDPKTCVAVGATVALMAGKLCRLDDFTIDTSLLKQNFCSTADYIGEYDPNKARLKGIFLDPDTDTKNVKFFGHMMLGMRQMPTDDWISAPMYKLVYSSQQAAQSLKDREPLTFDLERDARNKERLKPLRNILDKEGKKVAAENLKLTLQSLADEHGYWMDSGIFLIQLFDN
ncbi:MAG: virulence factor SrfB [Bacteroidales bacterium]|nr:virulence factor SrfB [Bacteroidales bacterium]